MCGCHVVDWLVFFFVVLVEQSVICQRSMRKVRYFLYSTFPTTRNSYHTADLQRPATVHSTKLHCPCTYSAIVKQNRALEPATAASTVYSLSILLRLRAPLYFTGQSLPLVSHSHRHTTHIHAEIATMRASIRITLSLSLPAGIISHAVTTTRARALWN